MTELKDISVKGLCALIKEGQVKVGDIFRVSGEKRFGFWEDTKVERVVNVNGNNCADTIARVTLAINPTVRVNGVIRRRYSGDRCLEVDTYEEGTPSYERYKQLGLIPAEATV